MGTVHALKGFIGTGKQAGQVDLEAALVARDRFSRFYEAEWQHNRQFDEEPTSGRAELEEVGLDQYDLRFRGTIEGSTEGILTRLLYSLMGAKASAQQDATAAYLHTLTVADTVPVDARLSFEQRLGTLAESLASNGIVRELTIDFTRPGFLRFPFEALCGKPERLTSPTAATLPAVSTLLTRRGAGLTGGLMTIGGEASAKVRSGTITLRRMLEEDDFGVLSQYRLDAEYGQIVAMFNVNLGFRDTVMLRKFWGGTAQNSPSDSMTYYATNLAFTRPDVIATTHRHLIDVNMPRSYLKPPSKPFRAGQFVAQTVEGAMTWDSATGKGVEVKVKNTQTTV